MKKFANLLGYTIALILILLLATQNEARATMATTSTVSIPATNMIGTWTGTASAVSEPDGYFDDVPVTLTVSDQATDSIGNTYLRGSITIQPPFGTGAASPVAGTVEIKSTTKLHQSTGVMWDGNGFMGCGKGTSVVTPSASTLIFHGCMHIMGGFAPQPAQKGPVAASAPATAIVDLTKQ